MLNLWSLVLVRDFLRQIFRGFTESAIYLARRTIDGRQDDDDAPMIFLIGIWEGGGATKVLRARYLKITGNRDFSRGLG